MSRIRLFRFKVWIFLWRWQQAAFPPNLYDLNLYEMQYQQMICNTWYNDVEHPIQYNQTKSTSFAFARINGITYVRPGFWNCIINDWTVE